MIHLGGGGVIQEFIRNLVQVDDGWYSLGKCDCGREVERCGCVRGESGKRRGGIERGEMIVGVERGGVHMEFGAGGWQSDGEMKLRM